MLYHRDEETGDHLVVHNGREFRYPTRAQAIAACRDLKDRDERPTDGTREPLDTARSR